MLYQFCYEKNIFMESYCCSVYYYSRAFLDLLIMLSNLNLSLILWR
jgi:hypothetical protein